MQRILITGASGLLGANVALEWAKAAPGAGQAVYGVVHKQALHTDQFQVVQADLLEPGALERVLGEVQPDWVVNCAALAVIDECEAQPDLAHRLNADMPAKLAKLVARGGARLMHLSTDAVFNGVRGDYTEEDEPNPLSVYARTKLAGERAVAEANPEAAIARVNLYGWSLKGTRSLAEWFFYALQAQKHLMGFTDVYFCPLLVNDLAHILRKMLALNLSGLYHAVSSECISKYAFGTAIARRFGLDEGLIRPASVAEAGLWAARSPNLTLRNDKLARAFGEPLPSFSTGLERFYTLYQQGYPQILRQMAEGDRAEGKLG